MKELNTEKLDELVGKVVGNTSAAFNILLAYIADQTGVYRAMADGKLRGADEIAKLANVDARYLQELLCANAASEYVSYDNDTESFYLTPEQTAVLAVEKSPANMHGLFQVIVAQYAEYQMALEVFRSGKGRSWGEQHTCQFCGTDRFFRPGYEINLIDNWIPAMDGVLNKLEDGGTIADIGCGHGSSSVLMAKSFPKSKIFGYDFHKGSIESAKAQAMAAGVNNIEFSTSDASHIPAKDGYDFVCIFDALHDMGDPVGVAKHILSTLKPDGTLMIVEPMAGDKTEDNLHPLGGVFYAASTLICLPNSRSQDVGLCLGAQAGPKRLIEILQEAGFSSVAIATTSATNLVIQAKA
ncbi:class I SAM-dependent methyltransferase [Shewanella nanhaiensis]|uniref:Class I SAM-dependent methyltransferase n=1 Tax=Shewanella nanhaiensis TaxID=2864872 RepID=A0ABS7E7H1_9GAMM|nr:class I SAM-dependent methyltransferase [Shewanella nanhaiensis]MBW8185612.1 class I SAM-dependent methyltransferase [Shewanella nanhaiensis]